MHRNDYDDQAKTEIQGNSTRFPGLEYGLKIDQLSRARRKNDIPRFNQPAINKRKNDCFNVLRDHLRRESTTFCSVVHLFDACLMKTMRDFVAARRRRVREWHNRYFFSFKRSNVVSKQKVDDSISVDWWNEQKKNGAPKVTEWKHKTSAGRNEAWMVLERKEK